MKLARISVLVASLCTAAWSATYYVTPTGDDVLGNGSSTKPWKTLSNTSRWVSPGDTLIACGTFTDDYFYWGWPATYQPLTLTACPAGATVTGNGQWGSLLFAYGPIIVNGLQFQNGGPLVQVPVTITTDGGVTLRNVTISNSPSAFAGVRILNSSNVSIISSAISGIGQPANQGSGDCVAIDGSHGVMIAGNTISKCAHAGVLVMDDTANHFAYNVVVRQNTIANGWGSGINLVRLSSSILIDQNVITDSGDGTLDYGKDGLQLAATNVIVRRNTIVNTGATNAQASSFIDSAIALKAYIFAPYHQDVMHNRIYNNVLYANATTPMYIKQQDDDQITDNKVVNNIFYFNRTNGPQEPNGWPSGDFQILFDLYHSNPSNKWLSFPNGNSFVNNIILPSDSAGDHPGDATTWFYDGGGNADLRWAKSLTEAQAAYPMFIRNNLEVNPGFVNAPSGDFSLMPSSAAIDAGAHLAATTKAGIRTTLVPVDDDLYFFDGAGITDGDVVQVGNNVPVKVVAIDRLGHALTVASPVTFLAGDTVDLQYNGSGPDIGVVESPFTRSAITVAVFPPSVVAYANQQQQFTASINNSPVQSVTWTISPPQGSVSATGLYTAPSAVTTISQVIVTATSVSDPSKTASATVQITPSVSVLVTPASVVAYANQQQQFSASVGNSPVQSVTWTISPPQGSVSATGLYTAPSAVTTISQVIVTATSVSDPSKTGSATVQVTPSVSVLVTPASVVAYANQQQQFSASVSNSPMQSVTWTISPPQGSVSATGLYTAPSAVATISQVIVTATSVSDPSKAGSATVQVTPTVSVLVTPASATVAFGQTQQFVATVSNSPNSGVTWSVSPAFGSITSGGLYRAPTSGSRQTVVVSAASVTDPTKVATAAVVLGGAVTYYVSSSGDDAKGDGSQWMPWRSLRAAGARVSSGDSLIACGWFVDDYLYWASGNGPVPLTVKACPNGAFISGNGSWGSMIFAFSPLIVDGLSLGPATSQVQVPVQISSPNVTLRNVAISGAASAYIGIRIWSSSNVAVSNCTIDGLGSKTGASGVGILVKGGTNVLISGNVLGNSGEADVEVQDGWDGTHSNVVAITGNRFANSWGSSLIVDKGQIGVTTNGNSGAN